MIFFLPIARNSSQGEDTCSNGGIRNEITYGAVRTAKRPMPENKRRYLVEKFMILNKMKKSIVNEKKNLMTL